MKKLILVFVGLVHFLFAFAQQDSTMSESDKQELRNLFKSKQIMMASLGYYKSRPSFLQENLGAGDYESFWYHDSYFLLGFGQGKYLRPSEYVINKADTFAFNDFSIGLNFNIPKWNIGRRLWDISGVMLVPQIGVCYNVLSAENESIKGLKVLPSLSLQLPYGAIDFRLNMDLRGGNHDFAKGLSFYPEIGIRIDGLYNIFDPEWTSNGHYEGTRTWKTVEIRTTYERDEITRELYEVTIRTETHHVENYNFDAYARNIGPFVAIGPRLTFSNHDFAGNTRMYGLGISGRMPMYGIDFFADYGKMGFASSFEKPEVIGEPKPKDNKINKEDYLFAGTYESGRIGGRIGFDLVESLMRLFYSAPSGSASATKFTRIQGGIGGGYALVNKPQYDRSYAPQYLDSLTTSDYTRLTTSVNDARFGENTTFFTYFISLEVGAVAVSWENYRYKYAPLANVRTMTVSYMLPYNRLIKRYKNLRLMKKVMTE
jgi:hypothetical protein